jgi:hypothetical protein
MNASPQDSRETDRDAELRRRLVRALGREPLLGQCTIHPGGPFELPRALVLFPEGAAGLIRVEIHAGAVLLRGKVPRTAQRELAGAIAGRLPGCRAVINELRVEP